MKMLILSSSAYVCYKGKIQCIYASNWLVRLFIVHAYIHRETSKNPPLI